MFHRGRSSHNNAGGSAVRSISLLSTSKILILFVAVLLLTSSSDTFHFPCLAVAAAASEKEGAEGEAHTAKRSTTTKNSWLEECRALGFDPQQLACTTCEILRNIAYKETAQRHHENCLGCCNSYKDGERQIRSKPYESAVLVLHRKAGGELETFLAEDWDDLVESKGERLRKMKHASKKEEAMEMDMLYFRGGAPAATLHFLEEKSGLTDLESIDELAKESIELDGWKREDIKDMIKTLLR